MGDNEDIPDHLTIRLSEETLKELAKKKSEGQSWDGVVSEILKELEEKEES